MRSLPGIYYDFVDIYSRHIDHVWRVAEALEYGIVGIDKDIIPTEIAPMAASEQID